MRTISTAAAQYANRPADESYPDMASMISAAAAEKATSREVAYNLKDLTIDVQPATETAPALPIIRSPKGPATFSHWGFGQFARMVGAPAAYLRTLPAANIASDLNFGISDSTVGSTVNLLVKKGGPGVALPIVRAATTDGYGRVWDADLYGAADRQVFSANSVSGRPWIAPPTWSGDTAGTWRGDRDSFVIRVDGGSIVQDPSFRGSTKDGQLFRGIMIRNSEVGASSIVISWVLFQFICGNLMLWGAVVDRKFRRRHVGLNVLRDTLRELGALAHQWTNRPASTDEAIITNLMTRELARTPEGVVDELRKMGYTLDQAKSAVLTCEQEFSGASPRSFWGLAQGTTRNSQAAPFQDERYELDQLASKLMARGARLVAA